jgi:hypothetical protein
MKESKIIECIESINIHLYDDTDPKDIDDIGEHPPLKNMMKVLGENGFEHGMISFVEYLNKEYYNNDPLWKNSAIEFFTNREKTDAFFKPFLRKKIRKEKLKELGI